MTSPSPSPDTQRRRLALLALGVSLVLLVMKTIAWRLSNSAALLTDALESIVNVVASAFALYSVSYAARPRDLSHPYGHGKIEFFSAGLEGAMIMIAGSLTLYEGAQRLMQPLPISNWGIATAAAVVGGLANGAVGMHLRRRGRQLHSLALQADGTHLLSDAWSSAALALGLAIAWATGWLWIDGVLCAGLSLLLLYKGYELMRSSISGLMDEANPELVETVVKVLAVHKKTNWIDVHHLKIQHYGPRLHIDCHVTLPYYYTLGETHRELTHMEQLLRGRLPYEVEIFIHPDPCLPQCCHYCSLLTCPVRSEDYKVDVVWDVETLYRNQKHFRQLGRSG